MLGWTVLSPFLLMPLAAWLGKRPFRWSCLLSLWPAILAFYFGSNFAATEPRNASLSWAEQPGLILTFHADGLSTLFAVLIAAIGSLIVFFASSYFDGHPLSGRFQATLFAFMGSMLGVVHADSLVTVFIFWELTGFTSFLLIGFDSEKKEARSSAIQALIVTGGGGLALLAAAVLLEQVTGGQLLSALIAGDSSYVRNGPAYPAIVLLILFAAFTKSAQAPFHFWLPNAMTAPTPVSAYLHSATMVKAGIYLVARMTPVLGGTPLWTEIIVSVGAVTMALGAWRSVAETDLKRVLAYSTISALGVLMMLLGVGTQTAVTAMVVYLVAHACYKGTLFLVAGTLEHETGTRNVTDLSGLRHSMPVTALSGALAAGSMVGIPLFLGFVGKELLYEALFHDGSGWTGMLLVAAIGASALLGSAGLIAGVSPFAGSPGRAAVAHAVPFGLAAPPMLLATAGLVAGFWPRMLDGVTGSAAASIVKSAPAPHLALWHGITPVLLLSILTVAMALLLYKWRAVIRRRIWPRSLGFERLYTLAIRLLDAVSAWSLPALQGASLRSYAVVLVLTASILLGAVLVPSELPSWSPKMDVRAHEVAAAAMVICGALSAVRAASTITALLSLGVTGYGVALIFVFFGAPDLAMTQFSVETLTAVIFVMVFYHFRAFGLLSSWQVRLRDALIAISFGSSIAVILFVVGAAPTPHRLSSYYAEMAVPLAHGRNIVNVILVDFRALDTLGEITVLATAALGVRAVLRLGRGNERT